MKYENSKKFNVINFETGDELVKAIDKIIEKRPEIFNKLKK